MYPKDKNEADKFAIGIINSLHDEKTTDGVMKQLTAQDVPVAARVAGVTAQVVSSMLARVQQQAKRKPNLQLILKAIKMTIMEVSKMAEIAGIKVTQEDKQNAAKLAGDSIDAGQRGGPQQAQPQAQPEMQQPQRQPILGGAQ